jgi:hypothetical protein
MCHRPETDIRFFGHHGDLGFIFGGNGQRYNIIQT